jgi:cytochrome b561
MAALPLSGWVIDSAAAIPFRVFWLFSLPRLVEPDKMVEELAKEAHLYLSFVLAALLAVHIAAALWHHWVRKDEVLVRMLFRRRRP